MVLSLLHISFTDFRQIVFYDTDIKYLNQVVGTMRRPPETYRGLVQAWYDGVPKLPLSTIEVISLDVTVAPGWTREDALERTASSEWQRRESKWHYGRLLRDARIGSIFLGNHTVGILRLASRLFHAYEWNVTINLTGKTGRGSNNFESKMTDPCIAGE